MTVSEFHFSSECRDCGQDRTQYGYEAAELSSLLKKGNRVDAQCAVCGTEWEISIEERAAIARALGVDKRNWGK